MFNVLATVIYIFIGPGTTEWQWFYILFENENVTCISKISFGFREIKQNDFWTWNR